ncbi:MAG: DUF998 domain-containing protein [Gemmatimonadales bacterium]|nr:DUF998 domain-containing protein [Gemmatimonadales bacterium]MDZ4389278.1 DUF998 domain-containing protein [Gemmatimonadales bacterium]
MFRQLSAATFAPVVWFGALLIGGLLFPGYDHGLQLPSELGAVGAPHPAVFNAGIVVTGLLLGFGAPGLTHGALRLGSNRVWAGALLVTILLPGVYFILVGLIPLPDPRHNALFPLLLPLQFGPFALTFGLRDQPAARHLRQGLLATGGLLLLFLAIALLAGEWVASWQGAFIRVYALLGLGWVAVSAARLKGWLRQLTGEASVIAI